MQEQNQKKKTSSSKSFPLKTELKSIAKKIKQLKVLRKVTMFGSVDGLVQLQAEYRYKHVAYSLLKGRSQHDIEPFVQNKNKSSFNELEVSAFLLKLSEKM